MGNYTNYTLLLGVAVDLGTKVIETNAAWKGIDDKVNPQYIFSEIPLRDCHVSRITTIKDPTYAYGEKEIRTGYVFPDEEIVLNLVASGAFSQAYQCDVTKLCFIDDERWLGEDLQLVGIALLRHSTADGYQKADEQKILAALNQKDKVAHMINRYGFDLKAAEISLHQYMMVEG